MQQQKDQEKEAYNFVLKLIGVHLRTIFEIENKLKDKNFSQKVIDQTIVLLKDQGYLDDKQYAEAWIEERIKNRPSGRALCWKKLREKGIEKDIIDKILGQILDEKKEIKLALKLAQNKKAELKARQVHWKKIPGRIGFFLQSRGFPTNIIIEVLEQLK